MKRNHHRHEKYSRHAILFWLAQSAASLQQSYTQNSSQTYSVFLTASGQIPFAPATARVFLRFLDASGASHGSTSVAVETD